MAQHATNSNAEHWKVDVRISMLDEIALGKTASGVPTLTPTTPRIQKIDVRYPGW